MARLLTNRELVPALRRVFEHFRVGGGDPHLLEPVLGVQPDYLRAAGSGPTVAKGLTEPLSQANPAQ